MEKTTTPEDLIIASKALVTVGRIVHYVEGEKKTEVYRAALVTQVHTEECIDVTVFYPTGMAFRTLVLHAGVGARPGYDEGTWHWPRRD
jgi:hypothetical protein